MKRLVLLMLLLPRAASEDFLSRGDGKEAPKVKVIKKTAVLSSTRDAASTGDGADDSPKHSSSNVVSVPLDSELQAAAGKVTPAFVEQSAFLEDEAVEKAEE
eukprot:CAMPEP_0172704814 /NCGR_PEP_ID=MMETSP1074-20121228/41952_1 /TAXON_ID=2916 /ORGANISM="Ceratium fusus, Strain PA161109" /LENGTH=101 /DNA_ID=CAMNT_0013527043 /DNA_START=75 /DNA_END=377 /DNA_ORIENTATION=-